MMSLTVGRFFLSPGASGTSYKTTVDRRCAIELLRELLRELENCCLQGQLENRPLYLEDLFIRDESTSHKLHKI